MLDGLKLWNFTSGQLQQGEISAGSFLLRTCQRTLVLSFSPNPFSFQELPSHQLITGSEAYYFLLETICGLQSKLIGENEIVGQFKAAYQSYASSLLKDTRLLLILEKLFKDSKDIRSQYLIGISQKTYASLTRKHLISKARASHVVIVGSGNLAEDLINQCKKKAKVFICARNASKVGELSKTHSLDVIPWEKRTELSLFPFIANTIGTNTILFDPLFFKHWSKINHRLFIDLGSPSAIQTEFSSQDGVIRLDDIFNEGAVVEEQKEKQISLARSAMTLVTQRREALFQEKFNRVPELFAPQSVSGVRYI